MTPVDHGEGMEFLRYEQGQKTMGPLRHGMERVILTYLNIKTMHTTAGDEELDIDQQHTRDMQPSQSNKNICKNHI